MPFILQLLADYGYLAVFIGCLLEGETILILAGFACHHGHLTVPLTLAVAVIGATLGDQLFYWIGRYRGPALLARLPALARRAERVAVSLKRYDALVVMGVRFVYGLRIAGPIAIGAMHMPPRRFATFNFLGALLWAPLVGSVGFLFGSALDALIGDVERIELIGTVLIVGAAIVITLVRRWRRSRAAAR
ncbi:DedA family protein [Variovorax sp. Sphag1AA]|uniref:DedA family protein n=1 Tax=Variovorax sp. Sphag1AA TaxID=2587027 RepID=UPI001618D0EE|nr:DedA family protein [Variovorax sp. Sphag1AA]MBB3179053.1 membrane protein DedA with SNARE-associated domain [Variovorax sp. Sphag1AA]